MMSIPKKIILNVVAFALCFAIATIIGSSFIVAIIFEALSF